MPCADRASTAAESPLRSLLSRRPARLQMDQRVPRVQIIDVLGFLRVHVIPIIDEPHPDLLWVDQVQENLRLYLPGGVAPRNEKELVDLFRLMSKDYFGYTSCTIQTPFPDRIAQR